MSQINRISGFIPHTDHKLESVSVLEKETIQRKAYKESQRQTIQI